MPDLATRLDLSALLMEGEALRPAAERHARPLGAPDRTDPGFRVESSTPKTANAARGDSDGEAKDVKLYIYSDIGGWFGVWPEDVLHALKDVKGNVELHLHSPGGDAFDGIAIYNLFRSHDEDENKGAVNVVVDGLAASAASVIAMAGSTVKMRKGAQMMIHDAWGFAQGPAEDMSKMGTFLSKISDSIAGIYAERAGGTRTDWRAAMQAESWYTDEEAVEAGLATSRETDSVATKNHWDLKSVFNYAGRDAAPAPSKPGQYARGQLVDLDALARLSASEGSTGQPVTGTATHPGSGVTIDYDALNGATSTTTSQASGGNVTTTTTFTTVSPAQAAQQIHRAAMRQAYKQALAEDDQTGSSATKTPVASPALGPSSNEGGSAMPDPKKVREALGLAHDATDAEVQAAWAAAYAPTPTPEQTPAAPAAPTATSEDISELAKMAAKMGITLIDNSQLAAMQAMAEQGQTAYKKQREGERDSYIAQAVKDGKIELSRVEAWKTKWDADPEGARQTIDALATNMVPMDAQGYAGTVAANEADTALYSLYPELKPQIGGGHRG